MRKRIVLSVLLMLCVWLTGCYGIVPMRQRTVAQQGPAANIDPGFLKKGETQRGEVLDKLKATDTGFASDRFFVGRWRTSKSGEWLAVGGYGGAAFGADRRWHNTNLLVQFDGNGAVESFEAFPDKLLAEKLAPLAQQKQLLETEKVEGSIALNGSEIPVSLSLSKESIEIAELEHFKALKHRPQYHYTVPRDRLQGVSVDRFQDNVTYLDISLHFASDLREFGGPRGKKVSVQVTVPQLITLLAYAPPHAVQPVVPKP
jgi:hypothetical protein